MMYVAVSKITEEKNKGARSINCRARDEEFARQYAVCWFLCVCVVTPISSWLLLFVVLVLVLVVAVGVAVVLVRVLVVLVLVLVVLVLVLVVVVGVLILFVVVVVAVAFCFCCFVIVLALIKVHLMQSLLGLKLSLCSNKIVGSCAGAPLNSSKGMYASIGSARSAALVL